MSRHLIDLTVNGSAEQVEVRAHRLLSELLRDDLHLTGTKRGCETGTCGACSVRVDGRVIKSCLTLAVQVQGKAVQTIEGLACEGRPSAVQDAFMQCGGLQCGYCTPGFVVTAEALLDELPNPSEHEVREGLSGNLCRCTGYTQIVESILHAASRRR